MLVVADAVAFERAVDDGILLQRDDGGAHEERHESKSRSVALLESVLEFVAQIDDASHVHFEHAVDVSAGAARFDHALRDDLAHVGHGHQIAGNRSWRGSRGWTRAAGAAAGASRAVVLDEIENVLLGDAAAGAGATHFCEIDIVLAGEFADQRGGADVGILFVVICGRARGCCGRRSGSSLVLPFLRVLEPRASTEQRPWRSGGRSAAAVANHADHSVDLNRVAFGNLDFLKDSAGGRGDFGVDLVGGNLE